MPTRSSLGASPEQPWDGFNHLWKSHAPLKTQLTAWRLILYRLPMKDRLCKFFELAPEDKLCSCCKLVMETSEHLLLHCTVVHKIWYKVSDWIGTCWVSAGGTKAHFTQFSNLLGGSLGIDSGAMDLHDLSALEVAQRSDF